MVHLFQYTGHTTMMNTRQMPSEEVHFRLTARDKACIKAAYDYRALTSPQIDALLFPATKGRTGTEPSSRCRHRLKLLSRPQVSDHPETAFFYRGEQPQVLSEGRKHFVYFLAPRGAAVVAALLGCHVEDLDWRDGEHDVRSLFLEHLLATNDVRVAITRAASVYGLSLPVWRDERTLKRDHAKDSVILTGPHGGQQRAAIIPDGYFVLEVGAYRHHQFLEVDRATETGMASEWGRRDWSRKIAAYLEYHHSGKYLERYGTRSMRVLTVTIGEKRLANLKAITEKIGGRSRFWFTTFARLTADTVLTAPIWDVAGRTERSSILDDQRSS